MQDDQLVDSLKKSINKADDDNAFNGENGDNLNGTGTESTQDRLINSHSQKF